MWQFKLSFLYLNFKIDISFHIFKINENTNLKTKQKKKKCPSIQCLSQTMNVYLNKETYGFLILRLDEIRYQL